jgi:hypothetical protein
VRTAVVLRQHGCAAHLQLLQQLLLQGGRLLLLLLRSRRALRHISARCTRPQRRPWNVQSARPAV